MKIGKVTLSTIYTLELLAKKKIYIERWQDVNTKGKAYL